MTSRVYQVLAWLLRLMLIGFIVERLLSAHWGAAATLTLFLLLSFAYLLRDDHLPNIFDVLVGAAAMLNAMGFTFGLYRRIPLYDEVAHAVTIFAVTLAYFFLVYRDLPGSTRAPVMALSVFTLGVTVGSLWEVVEWSAEFVLNTDVVYGLDDAMTDLVANSAGALAAALASLAIRRERNPEGAGQRVHPR